MVTSSTELGCIPSVSGTIISSMPTYRALVGSVAASK